MRRLDSKSEYLALRYAPGVIVNSPRKPWPEAARKAHARALAAYAKRFAPGVSQLTPATPPRMSAMLEGWRLSAEEFEAAPDRNHFIRVAQPGEAYAPHAVIITSMATWRERQVHDNLAISVPVEALPGLQDDMGEAFAAACFARANRSPLLERKALIVSDGGQPEILGMRITNRAAEPCPIEVVRHWHRPGGPDDRVCPGWLERAALVAGELLQ